MGPNVCTSFLPKSNVYNNAIAQQGSTEPHQLWHLLTYAIGCCLVLVDDAGRLGQPGKRQRLEVHTAESTYLRSQRCVLLNSWRSGQIQNSQMNHLLAEFLNHGIVLQKFQSMEFSPTIALLPFTYNQGSQLKQPPASASRIPIILGERR
eukprot:3167868-Amphidinium_carterae.1